MARVRALLGCLLLAIAPGALAARLELPLRVPMELVREALTKQLSAQSGGTGELWREGACRYLRLEPPTLEAAERGLLLSAPGTAMVGAEVLGTCAKAADWDGTVRFILEPRIDSAGVLRLRVLDAAMKDKRGDKSAALAWDVIKPQLQARIERFSYDLGTSRATLSGVLHGVELQMLEPRVENTHVVVPIALEFPDAWLANAGAGQSTPAAPLTEAEIDALEKALEPVDAFLVYAIRQVAADNANPELRQKLFTLLLDSRYQLTAILAGDEPRGPDPVRTLFVDTWNQLRAILTDARYTLFVDSGDALLALEKAAPGLSLSADGLRQLARALRPNETGDPLAYEWGVDPQLRDLFRVEPLPDKTSSIGLFIKVSEEQPLDQWVPSRSELSGYAARIDALLKQAAAAELQRKPLPAPHDRTFAHLVPTTALIESCWRQYVVRGGKVTYLRSQSRSVGIMQINQHVWRGFYDVQRLRWDTAYNIRAGTQILHRYVKDYAIPYAEKSGEETDIPRAAYAVYNAGPRAVGRFAKAELHPREKRVDDKLLSLYQGVASGGQVDLESCAVKNASL